MEAGENFRGSIAPGEEGTVYTENGEPIAHSTEDGSVQLSIRTYEEQADRDLEAEVQYFDRNEDGFADYDIAAAVYGIRYEPAERGHDLVKIGTMPSLYRKLFSLTGDVYVSNAHLYQNMVSRRTAEAEDRFDPKSQADYHELPEETIISAIDQFQNPIAIMESLKDYREPRLVAILDEKGTDGQHLLTVMELYSEKRAFGVSQLRNYVLITIYEKSSLPEYIGLTAEKERVLHIRKGNPSDKLASLQLTGKISDESLEKNIARFNKKVKAFKEANKIQYSDRDSSRKVLSKQQQEFFARSRVRDADGNLLVMYHGTSAGGHTVFDPLGTHYDLRLYWQPLPDHADYVYFSKNKICCNCSYHTFCHHVHSLLPAGNGRLAGYCDCYDAGQFAGILSASGHLRSDHHFRKSIPCLGCVPDAVRGFDHSAGSCDIPGVPENTTNQIIFIGSILFHL